MIDLSTKASCEDDYYAQLSLLAKLIPDYIGTRKRSKGAHRIRAYGENDIQVYVNSLALDNIELETITKVGEKGSQFERVLGLTPAQAACVREHLTIHYAMLSYPDSHKYGVPVEASSSVLAAWALDAGFAISPDACFTAEDACNDSDGGVDMYGYLPLAVYQEIESIAA